MSVAEADRLHAVAHQAANSVRSVEDWWEGSLTTAMAAVTRARHSSAYRDEAEGAVSRMLRWWRDENPRRISRDVAALALTARAAADLQRREPELVTDAAAAVSGLAERDLTTVPLLHLALSAWALDALVPDRSAQPWPELRAALEGRRFGGVEEPLRLLTLALAAERFDANSLVQGLLGSIGSSPSSSDSCTLLWVITAASERLTQALGADDNALRVLLQRRASIVERLAGEVDDATFHVPDLEEYGEPVAENLPAIKFLSPFEALMLDFALASSAEAEAWLLYPEAEALFGASANEEREKHKKTVDSRLRTTGSLIVAVGVLAGLACWLGLEDAGWKQSVSASIGLAVAATIALFGSLYWSESTLPKPLTKAAEAIFGTAALMGVIEAVNTHRAHPFISDVGGLVTGALILTGVSVLVFSLDAIRRRLSRLPS